MTLVEIVIAIALLGIAVVSIVAAWQGAITSSTRNKVRADLQVVLQSAAEAVASKDVPLLLCTATPDNQADIVAAYQVPAALADLGDDWDITVDQVLYYNPLGAPSDRPWTTTCPENDRLALQLVQLTVTNPKDGRSGSVEVVKE
jgi:type II secretory pathway pseudopilin PulG